MTKPLIAVCMILAVLTTGCDLGPNVAAAETAINALAENKELAEKFVKDLKAAFAPESATYKQAKILYEQARATTNGYVGQVALAALTDDPAAPVTVQAEAAHAAQTVFLENAARSLHPEVTDSRAIPFGLILNALPPLIHKVMSDIQAKQRTNVVRTFSDKAHWRSWDEL